MLPNSQFTPFSNREKNPTVDDKGCEGNDLSIPRRHEQVAHTVDGIDIRPVKSEIEESHATKSGPDKVCNSTPGSNPAEKR